MRDTDASADLLAPDFASALVLASSSPRRREILARAGVRHEVIPPRIDELARPGEAPEALALRLADEKARDVAAQLARDDQRLVLAADTIVVLDGDVLGKPRDEDDARRMLGRLVGRRHVVITGVALAHARHAATWQLAVRSGVEMRAASAEEIRAYVATGEPMDKAGSYGVQGEGGRRFVIAIDGSETNVMGLPIDETLALLARARAELADGAPVAARARADRRDAGAR